MGVDEGREAIRGMKTSKAPNPGRRIRLYMPKLHQCQELRMLAVSKVWKYMYGIHVFKQTQDGLKHTHAQIDWKQPGLPAFLSLWLLHTRLT